MKGRAYVTTGPGHDSGPAHSPRWWRYLAASLLALTLLVSVSSLLAGWLINAEAGGLRNLGIAISASYAWALGLYVSLALAGINFLAALVATVSRLRSRLVWLATGIALIPMGWFAMTG